MLIRRHLEKLRKAFWYASQSTWLKVDILQSSVLQIVERSFGDDSWNLTYLLMLEVSVELSKSIETSYDGGSITCLRGL